MTNAGLLNGSSISTTERVVSQLTISNVTERDLGEYTCSVQGNSTTTTPIIVGAGIAIEDVFVCTFHSFIFSSIFLEIAEPIQVKCDGGKPLNTYNIFDSTMYFCFPAGALIGGVVGLALLLLISMTINILAMIYCIYQLRVKSTQNVHVGEREEMEMLCVQVEEQQQAAVVVDMKQNNT